MDVVADRSTRFLARVDAHLATVQVPLSRQRFLEQQLLGWHRAYARFVSTEGASEPETKADDPPHCSDFLLTITGLRARLERERGARVAA